MRTEWKPVRKREDSKHFILVQVIGNRIMADKRGFIPVKAYGNKPLFTETMNREILDTIYNTDKYA